MPKSVSFTLILRRSAARIVSCVMGSSYVLPVRLSVTVSVSCDLADASVLRASVADVDVEESIERSLRGSPGGSPAAQLLYTKAPTNVNAPTTLHAPRPFQSSCTEYRPDSRFHESFTPAMFGFMFAE